MRWPLFGGVCVRAWAVGALCGVGVWGCDAPEPFPGFRAGNRAHVSTPASGSNAQGAVPPQDSNAGAVRYGSRVCTYRNVVDRARREEQGGCVSTTFVGAGEAH